MKISFICSVISHARFQRRFKFLQELGAEIKVYSFERNYYSGQLYVDKYISLGEIEDGKYLNRILPYLKSFNKIRRAIENSDVLYIFGLDLLLLTFLAKKTIKKDVKIIYEVGDIRGVLLKDSYKSKIFRKLEKKLLKDIDRLIVTSEAYIDGYYHEKLDMKDLNYQVIENKVMPKGFSNSKDQFNQTNDKIVIGYFGMLRCQWSWDILQIIANKGQEKFEIYLRGIPKGLKQFNETVEKTSNISYGGPYKSPDDLAEIYNSCDIVWACSPYKENDIGDWKWARATRFYEALYFKKPIVSQTGTEDAKFVSKYEIGKNISLGNIKRAADEILKLSNNDLANWHENIIKMPDEIYLYTDEHQKLYNFLQK